MEAGGTNEEIEGIRTIMRIAPKSIMLALFLAVSTGCWPDAASAQEPKVTITHMRTIQYPDTMPRNLQSGASGIAWSHDGQRLAAIHDYGSSISIWDPNGQLLRTIKRSGTTGPYTGPVVFMPKNHLLLGPGPSDIPGRVPNILAIWDVDTGKIERLVENPNRDGDPAGNSPSRIELSPDGAYGAVSPVMSAVSIYSTGDWRLVSKEQIKRSDIPIDVPNDRTLPNMAEMINCLAWSVKNELAISVYKGVAITQPLLSPSVVGFIPSIYDNFVRPVRSMAYSHDGSNLALGVRMSIEDYAKKRAKNGDDETQVEKINLAYMKIWDTQKEKFIAFDPDIDDIRDLEWSPDGRYLLMITQGGDVRLYQPMKHGGDPIYDFNLGGRPVTARFSPAGDSWAVLLDTLGKAPTIEIYQIAFDK